MVKTSADARRSWGSMCSSRSKRTWIFGPMPGRWGKPNCGSRCLRQPGRARVLRPNDRRRLCGGSRVRHYPIRPRLRHTDDQCARRVWPIAKQARARSSPADELPHPLLQALRGHAPSSLLFFNSLHCELSPYPLLLARRLFGSIKP